MELMECRVPVEALPFLSALPPKPSLGFESTDSHLPSPRFCFGLHCFGRRVRNLVGMGVEHSGCGVRVQRECLGGNYLSGSAPARARCRAVWPGCHGFAAFSGQRYQWG